MELLIIKCNEHYIRVKENEYMDCQMDKASVFPIEKLSEVKKHIQILKKERTANVLIRKLIIIEEPFEDNESFDG